MQEQLSADEVALRFPGVFARAQHAVRTWCRLAKQAGLAEVPLTAPYEWQAKILRMVQLPPSARKVLWCWDPLGNAGKSYLAKHLVRHFNAFYCTGGKHADVFHAYGGQEIAIFDFPRDSEEFVCYGVIEAFKNGIFFSAKYESVVKQFNVPHVLVFSNFLPTYSKFSEDRWALFKIEALQLILFKGGFPEGYSITPDEEFQDFIDAFLNS